MEGCLSKKRLLICPETSRRTDRHELPAADILKLHCRALSAVQRTGRAGGGRGGLRNGLPVINPSSRSGGGITGGYFGAVSGTGDGIPILTGDLLQIPGNPEIGRYVNAPTLDGRRQLRAIG